MSLFSRLLLSYGWAAALGYSSRLCPHPVGPSLPPCFLLLVHCGGYFRLGVSGGGLPCLHCQCVFGDGRESPPLSFFTVRFHILGVCSCGFSLDVRGPHFPPCRPLASDFSGRRCPSSSPVSSLLLMGEGVLVFWVSAGLAVLSSIPALLALTALLFRRRTLCLFFFFFFLILCSCFCFLHSFLYRIAAAWLLHVRTSAGWELMVPAV